MKVEQIKKNLTLTGYLITTKDNSIIGEGRDKRNYVLAEIRDAEESIYLGKVVLLPWDENIRESSVQLERYLMENKIPFQHQKKN